MSLKHQSNLFPETQLQAIGIHLLWEARWLKAGRHGQGASGGSSREPDACQAS